MSVSTAAWGVLRNMPVIKRFAALLALSMFLLFSLTRASQVRATGFKKKYHNIVFTDEYYIFKMFSRATMVKTIFISVLIFPTFLGNYCKFKVSSQNNFKDKNAHQFPLHFIYFISSSLFRNCFTPIFSFKPTTMEYKIIKLNIKSYTTVGKPMSLINI